MNVLRFRTIDSIALIEVFLLVLNLLSASK